MRFNINFAKIQMFSHKKIIFNIKAVLFRIDLKTRVWKQAALYPKVYVSYGIIASYIEWIWFINDA